VTFVLPLLLLGNPDKFDPLLLGETTCGKGTGDFALFLEPLIPVNLYFGLELLCFGGIVVGEDSETADETTNDGFLDELLLELVFLGKDLSLVI